MSIISKMSQRIIKMVPVKDIKLPKNQVKKNIEEDELLELATSIQQNGLLQPILARKSENNNYELIAGERRLQASSLAGLEKIPCIVMKCDDKEAATFSIVENLQRIDLSIFEEAQLIKDIIDQWGVSQNQVAKKLGKNQTTIANKLKLLTFSEQEQKLIQRAKLTEKHAEVLLKISNSKLREMLIKEISLRDLNIQQTESLIKKILKIEDENNKSKTKVVVKDVRIFINTITKAISTMKISGIKAESVQKETEDYIEYVIKIPKQDVQKDKQTA